MKLLKMKVLKLQISLVIAILGTNFIVNNINMCGFSQNSVKAMEACEEDNSKGELNKPGLSGNINTNKDREEIREKSEIIENKDKDKDKDIRFGADKKAVNKKVEINENDKFSINDIVSLKCLNNLYIINIHRYTSKTMEKR